MSSPLIDVRELNDLLTSGAPVTVLDVRYRVPDGPDPDGYAAGHIPGACYVDMNTDLADPPLTGPDVGRHPLPALDRFGAAMRRVGVRHDRPVVVYDDWAAHAAGRAWWLLRHHGHDQVRVLDGGWAAWCDAGLSASSIAPAPEPGDFTPRPGRLGTVGEQDLAGVSVVIDARAPERYRGEVEQLDPKAGHIPGAVNLPTSSNLDPSGRFLPAAELRQHYISLGVTAGSEAAVYCGSGVTACHDLLAMEIAGLPGAALYPGSWSAWVSDPDRPVALGPQ